MRPVELLSRSIEEISFRGFSMLRIVVCLTAVLIIGCDFHGASAQTTNPAGATTAAPAKPSRARLTVERLKEMKTKWLANRPKLKACRKEVRAKGLVGDDRWFYIEDCMERT
jgi:hypothetical protein